MINITVITNLLIMKDIEKIYKNPYFISILVFFISLFLFWRFKIGYKQNCYLDNGNVICQNDKLSIKNINWKYSLALAILAFVLWYYCLFPTKTLKGYVDVNSLKINNDSVKKSLALFH